MIHYAQRDVIGILLHILKSSKLELFTYTFPSIDLCLLCLEPRRMLWCHFIEPTDSQRWMVDQEIGNENKSPEVSVLFNNSVNTAF